MTPPAQEKHLMRCERCDFYDLRDTVQMGEWISVGTCGGKIISDSDVRCIAEHGCASHSDIRQHPYPPKDTEQCPHWGIEHSDGMEWTCSKTGDTQRIADAIKGLEIIAGKLSKGQQMNLAAEVVGIIALLRESKP